MLDMKDWMSGLAGAIIFLLGLLPILNKSGKGAAWFGFELSIIVMAWILLLGSVYLLVDAFVEITNSNIFGWISLLIALVFGAIGLLRILSGKFTGFLAMEWVTAGTYSILFLILGFFLMIGTFARKL